MQKKTSKAASKAASKVKLSDAEIKAVKKRMAQLKKEIDNKKNTSTQGFIPYIDMLPDGICHVTQKTYSKTIQFYDINYRLSTFDEMNRIFSKYCKLLNYFDDSVKIQLSFENQNSQLSDMLKELYIPPQKDDFNDIRSEYSDYEKSQLIKGTNGKMMNKYLTYTVEAPNLRAAKIRLESISEEIISLIKGIGVKSRVLDGKERLEVFYNSLNPFTDKPFIFDWAYAKKTGQRTKNFIAPTSMNFKKSSFEIGKYYGAVSSLSILSEEISDEILNDFLKENHLYAVNMHIEPIDQLAALRFVRRKLTDLGSTKINEQKKASREGYDPDILPPKLKEHLKSMEEVLEDLNGKSERLFKITFIVRSYAKTKKALAMQQDYLKRTAQKNNCGIVSLDYNQEKSFASTLPLGYNAVPINRVLTTSVAAGFMPFTTQELFQGGYATYYGLNDLTKNLILADRKNLKNPNGLILGTPGGGKSFATKREIIDVFLKTLDDIFICDPEAEYYLLVMALNGQVIKISADSDSYVNPMEISWDNSSQDENKNPITVKSAIASKSDMLISLMELVVGGDLEATERTAIDKCVQQVYKRFFANNPSTEKMPILGDLWKELKLCGDAAKRVADSLEMYVTGSHNLFNHRSNVDMNNRVICFDIKELGGQLRKIAMLILQDTVWSRVASNRDKKATRYYIDEFHLLLREPQTAAYSVEMWKRFRKWGGIPTGITQNVKDLLASPQIQNIFDNSDFYYLLNQSTGDRDILKRLLNLSDEEVKYITNSDAGSGLICYGDIKLPFIDKFPKNTKTYKLLETTPKTKTPQPEELPEDEAIESKVMTYEADTA